MLVYKFFDYKDNIPDEARNNNSLFLTIFMIVAIVAIILLCVFLRNTKRSSVDRYLKIISIIVPIIEIIKIVWESTWDISTGKGFNWDGLLPLYTCSMFIFALPFAAWCKGKVQKCAVGFLTTLCIFAGLTNFFIPPILNYYPFFTFATFVSLYFHTLMVFTGLFLVSTRYFVPKFKDGIDCWLPVVAFSIIVIPANFIIKGQGYNPDYMLYMAGNGAPLLPDIAEFFSSHNITLIYSLLMMMSYLLITYLFIGIYQLIILMINAFKEKKHHENIE